MSEDELAHRLRAPYRALYLAAKRAEAEAATAAAAEEAKPAGDAPASAAHREFRDEVAELLASVDMSEEDRQRVLASLSCTCCGGSGLTLAFEIKPLEKAKF